MATELGGSLPPEQGAGPWLLLGWKAMVVGPAAARSPRQGLTSTSLLCPEAPLARTATERGRFGEGNGTPHEVGNAGDPWDCGLLRLRRVLDWLCK